MAGAQNIEQARYKNMLESLQSQDPSIEQIVAYSKFVVAYLLQQEGQNPGWRKANIEGPVYVVRRKAQPAYQLIVKNQFSATDLQDNLHPAWELDCQKNYVFYKVEDTSKRIRGLWFHDDSARQKLEAELEKILQIVRSSPQGEPIEDQAPPVPARQPLVPPHQQAKLQQQVPPRGGAQNVVVTQQTLSNALHQLADDSAFLGMVMGKLAEASAAGR